MLLQIRSVGLVAAAVAQAVEVHLEAEVAQPSLLRLLQTPLLRVVTSTLIWRNNIAVGYPYFFSTDVNQAGLYLNVTPGPALIRDHNIWYNIRNAVRADGTGSSCVDPKLVNSTLLNPDVRLCPDSPAINGGTSVGAPTVDLYNSLRPARGAVDIGAVEVK